MLLDFQGLIFMKFILNWKLELKPRYDGLHREDHLTPSLPKSKPKQAFKSQTKVSIEIFRPPTLAIHQRQTDNLNSIYHTSFQSSS